MTNKYVYLLGMDRSGSTLLTLLLNAHPQIASVGEVARVGRTMPERWEKKTGTCSCGIPFYRCDFWNQVLAGLAARGYGISQPDFLKSDIFGVGRLDYLYRRLLTKPLGRKFLLSILPLYRGYKLRADEKFKAFVDAVLEVADSQVFLDASKSSRIFFPRFLNPHFDVYVLNLYRDGRAIVNSWRNALLRWETDEVGDEQFEDLIQKWIKSEQERCDILKWIPDDRMYSLKYEDLCIDPSHTIKCILHFLKLDERIDLLHGYKSKAEHHIMGNRVRLSPNERIILDKKFLKQMTDHDLTLFEDLGGRQINAANGYTSGAYYQ